MKYLSKLSLEEIEDFFRNEGLEPFIYVKNKLPISPFVEGGESIIYKCYFPKTQEMKEKEEIQGRIEEYLAYQFPTTSYIMNSVVDQVNQNVTIIDIDDFSANILDYRGLTELNEKINEDYVKFMYKTFGEEYREDYNNFVEEWNKKVNEERLLEENEN